MTKNTFKFLFITQKYVQLQSKVTPKQSNFNVYHGKKS